MEWGGRYRLIRQLARGGMGEVWEAQVTGEGGFVRRVAIKRLISEHSQDPSQARMFLDEARIASQLHHANILSILDYGVVEGLPYQVLEYVDGMDAERLRQRGLEAGEPLPVELALHVCTEVAHALEHAHDARDAAGQPLGIVHRDVSPSNILISWTGDVKLADFGIALARDRQEQTLAGHTKGKPAYMSPEQLTRGELDGRSDLFALGCVLHALLTGDSPLAGEDRMVDLLAGKELELSESLPAELRELIARAVRRARHQRFQSAAEFAAASGKVLASRIDRDGRSLLREWMARVRAKEEASAQAAPTWARSFLEVDQLLGEVVAPATGGVTGVGSPPAPAVEPSSVEEQGPRFLPEPRTAARRRWRWALLPLTVLGGLGAVQSWRLAQREAPSVSSKPPEPAPSGGPGVAEKAEASVAETPSTVRQEAPAPPSPPREQGSVDKKPARSRPGPGSVGSESRPRHAHGSGTLAVGGAGALRAEVIINGQRKGHAPMHIELPVGEYTLELETPEGHRVGPKRIHITEFHTPISPLRWVVPERQGSREGATSE